MPPKKRKPIGKVLPEVSKKRNVRSAETAVQREHRLRINRERASTSRAAESVGQRENRLQQDRDRASTSRAAESVGQRENRLRQNRNRVSTSRAAETPQEHTARILNVRERTLASRNSRDRLSNLTFRRSLGNLNKNKFSGETNLELPKFQMPTFSGDISDWLSFKEIFIRSIDQNPTLGNFQKLQYSNSALKGNAARLIRAFNISDENYPIAWQTLINRFDKKSELAFKQIQNLYDLKNVKQESTKDLLITKAFRISLSSDWNVIIYQI
ncbi:hypothetical protein LAZ67_23000860 [Cordylochernes scorpioides]|uniref:STPR domain-containing protein n=1 Tax=Cordylochernes scorpioides TaxID=51811 RepID=A0ABY6LSQ0_9ARAC|nr:hypothetical protein LAZ67_23000860 [Cordylochernes scorpioides]